VEHAIPVTSSNTNCGSVLDPSAGIASNDSRALDYRLEEVINRYSTQSSGDQDEIQDSFLNVFWNEETTSIADGVSRMPVDNDLPLWVVQVQVSLSLTLLWFVNTLTMKDGTKQESFYLLHERLQAWPHLALAVFLPPGGVQWICVESARREYVEKLCVNLSTFVHPLQIFLVPVNKRLTWLKWQHQGLPIAPAWGRLKRKSELQELLLQDASFDKRILKYSNNLVFVNWTTESLVGLYIVPCLPVPISKGEDNLKPRQKTK
jgi:hypothetical protein